MAAWSWKNLRMATPSEEKIRTARELCEKGLWADVLAHAQKWHAEDSTDAKALFYTGVAQAATGSLIEAETSYRRALAVDATDFKTWNNLAALLFDALNLKVEGAKCLMQALQIDSGNPLGWANLASMNGQLGKHQQALECAERALALDPQMVEAHLHQARAARALGKTDIVRDASEALARLPLEKFRRSR